MSLSDMIGVVSHCCCVQSLSPPFLPSQSTPTDPHTHHTHTTHTHTHPHTHIHVHTHAHTHNTYHTHTHTTPHTHIPTHTTHTQHPHTAHTPHTPYQVDITVEYQNDSIPEFGVSFLSTVEPPNRGHFGTTASRPLSSLQRLSNICLVSPPSMI